MANIRKIDRPRPLEIQLPASIREKIDALLYSDLEGRVPHGAYTKFFTSLALEHLKSKGLIQ